MKNLEWLICRDPVHIGGADSSSRGNRNPIYRLPDGTPVIPGSSLRGALREHAGEEEAYQSYVTTWFGSEGNDGNQDSNEESKMIPGSIALGWAWPLWWPVHVLGYGNWWITCPAWLKRFWQLQGDSTKTFSCNSDDVYWTNETLKKESSVYFRWLKLTGIKKYPNSNDLPDIQSEVTSEKRIIVPDDKINLFVDMGLIRQPRVSLKSREEYWEELEKKELEKKKKLQESEDDKTSQHERDDQDENSLVKNLFSVEGLPPGAVFFFAWTTRNTKSQNTENNSASESEKTDERESKNNLAVDIDNWTEFLRSEHYIGGLWGIGYGRVSILEATVKAKDNYQSDSSDASKEKTTNFSDENKEPSADILETKEPKKPQLISPPKHPDKQ